MLTLCTRSVEAKVSTGQVGVLPYILESLDGFMDALIEQLNDPDVDVRAAAIQTAAGTRDEQLIEQLQALVLNSDTGPDGRESAALALARMEDPRGVRFLTGLMESADATIRGLAALGMSQQQTPQAVSFLIAALNDSVNTVRNIAERSLLAIIETVRESGIPELLSLLEHEQPLTRSPAARILGATQSTEARDPLLRVLQTDTHWLSRLWAAKALGDLGDTGAFSALTEVLQHDEKNRVRAAAAEAIGRLRAPGSADVLKQALSDSDEGVRKRIEESLEELSHTGA